MPDDPMLPTPEDPGLPIPLPMPDIAPGAEPRPLPDGGGVKMLGGATLGGEGAEPIPLADGNAGMGCAKGELGTPADVLPGNVLPGWQGLNV
jgi:hypothetical protein